MTKQEYYDQRMREMLWKQRSADDGTSEGRYRAKRFSIARDVYGHLRNCPKQHRFRHQPHYCGYAKR